MKTRPLENLVKGQIVAVMNCREFGFVVKREAKNLYLINQPTLGLVSIRRSALSCYVLGRWVSNSDAGQLAPHPAVCGK